MPKKKISARDLEALRIDASRAYVTAGLSLKEVEDTVGLPISEWTPEHCKKAKRLAREAQAEIDAIPENVAL